jgi:hypothetical protein
MKAVATEVVNVARYLRRCDSTGGHRGSKGWRRQNLNDWWVLHVVHVLVLVSLVVKAIAAVMEGSFRGCQKTWARAPEIA